MVKGFKLKLSKRTCRKPWILLTKPQNNANDQDISLPLDFPFYLYSFCLSLFFLSILPPTQRAPTAQGPMVATPGSMMAASTAPSLYPSSETAFLIHDPKYIWTLQFINIRCFTEIKFSFLHFYVLYISIIIDCFEIECILIYILKKGIFQFIKQVIYDIF